MLRDKVEAVLYTYVVGTFNVLGWHHTEPGGKNSNMRDGVWRIREAIKLWNRNKLSVVALQECEEPQANVIDRRRNWKTYRASPNNLLADGNRLFNALAYKLTVWKFIGGKNLHIPMRGRARGLNFPVLKLKHRWTGRKVAFICFHFPRYGGNEDPMVSRQTVETARRLLREERMRLEAEGYLVIVLGDANTVRVSEWFRTDGFDATFNHGVDAGASRGFARKFSRVTALIDGVKGILSDHPLVFASIIDKPVKASTV